MSCPIRVVPESAIRKAATKPTALAALRFQSGIHPSQLRDLPCPPVTADPVAKEDPVPPEIPLAQPFHFRRRQMLRGAGYFAKPLNRRCQKVSMRSGAEHWTLLPSSGRSFDCDHR